MRQAPNPEPASLTQSAFEAVLGMIVSGELSGGAVLNERRLADRLQVSRTPLREALGRLEGQHYLRRSGRALIVNSVDLNEILENLTVRRVLERESAALAAGRMLKDEIAAIRRLLDGMTDIDGVDADRHWEIDDLIHLSIARASGNALLTRLIGDLRRRTRMFGKERIPDRFEPGRAEHLAILDAIEAGSAPDAAEAMARHIGNARDSIIAKLTRRPVR